MLHNNVLNQCLFFYFQQLYLTDKISNSVYNAHLQVVSLALSYVKVIISLSLPVLLVRNFKHVHHFKYGTLLSRVIHEELLRVSFIYTLV